ncbi:magnesium/cobalt transporter CorA [Candidatus Fermentibacteria bacterium]|nr:magnesium/cobalt transporter CorA [Candidatus Fermentibacteria bacterium]
MKSLADVYPRRRGDPPGFLTYLGRKEAQKTRLRVIDYDEREVREYRPERVDEVLRFRESPGVSWIDVTGLGDTGALEEIGKGFGIHQLVLEDILNTSQRPKADLLEDYVFIVLKMIHYGREQSELDIEQVSLILGPGWVISFQEKEGDVFDPLRERIREGKGSVRGSGPDYLAYAIIDVLVDNYFLVLENLGEQIERLEDEVVQRPRESLMAGIHRYKRELLFLRKSTWPLREQLGGFLRDEHPLVTRSTVPYLRDLYEHTMQVIDTVETFRDMVSGLLEVYLSSMSNRMNEIMKVLTVIATIFIPLTFIAGVYGMNFRHMPELDVPWAYPAVLGFCLMVAGVMIVYFRRKKWL